MRKKERKKTNVHCDMRITATSKIMNNFVLAIRQSLIHCASSMNIERKCVLFFCLILLSHFVSFDFFSLSFGLFFRSSSSFGFCLLICYMISLYVKTLETVLFCLDFS